LKKFAENKYERNSFKKHALFLSQVCQTYPFSKPYLLECLIEKFPHKNMSSENLYIYNKICMQIAKDCPDMEEKILEIMVEKLCFLDVDVKLRKRRFEFSQASSI
jgi:hypothetical protein